MRKTAWVLLPAAIWLSACGKHTVEASAAPPDIPTVAVAHATTEDLSQGLALTAEFRPYQEVDVMAKVAGYIKQINVDVGDRVARGQIIATLEVPEMRDDLRKADASVVRAQAEVTRAEDELRRAEQAHSLAHLSAERLKAVAQKKPGLIAQQEIDEATSRDLVAEAQVASAKSAIAATQEQVNVNAADTSRVKTMIDYTRIVAPFSGVVTKRYADTGSMMQAATPAIRLSENSTLRLILPVPESAVPSVHAGQQVEVKVAALNRSFPGRVARFSEKLSTATRTMDTEVDVVNPDLLLKPGMYAEVNLTLDRRNKVVAVPVMAVDGENGGFGQVMIVTPNNRVEKRRVATGIETANFVEVKSGLNDGDAVVLSGRASLQAGQEVRPKVASIGGEKQGGEKQ